ncbi:MAG: aminotransferase class I/II-fold pyridoxal phosphate-dependent enzyme [Clostridia bacterium]|nr:aminotransferase class I/II-fold pyridoxal phosphate-dependent enzyme [Clostridia bacterium]
MRIKVFTDKKTRAKCKIFQMLKTHAGKKHLSFHTPGHKSGAWDITELSFSDNLASPHGCIAEAERDIAELLGAKKSFILTDGSTSGVLSILYVAKLSGVKKVAVCVHSHKSVFNGCAALGLTPVVFTAREANFCPAKTEPKDFLNALENADALFLTSPDYYGNIPDLKAIRALCDREKKLLLVDGAHGGHLHFDKTLYAGAYADLWVDGVHKSLPALTQGAVVSARTEETAEALLSAVGIFRTTSPSYPVMASVEYAVKYPRNHALETAVKEYADATERVFIKEDYTKLCAIFGKHAAEAEKALEADGIFAEFCDGNTIMFYLSPATDLKAFSLLKKRLDAALKKYPYESVKRIPAPLVLFREGETERIETEKAIGRICAENCGIFPPCTPLIFVGEEVTAEKIALLKKANNVFGVYENKIRVFKEEKRE